MLRHFQIPLVIALCCSLPNVSGKPLTVDEDEDEDAHEYESTTPSTTTVLQFDDTVKLEDAVLKEVEAKVGDSMPDKMPILPPIILLDFANDTDENENMTREEKSKRTVDNGLGYGLNNIQTRRYSYYFPSGKSGTTVSIEESISPFLPKTIIERVPDNHNPQKTSINVVHHNSFAMSTSFSEINSQNERSQHNFGYLNLHRSTKPQSLVYGLRAKPQNTANENYRQTYFTTSKPGVLSSLEIQNSDYARDNGGAITTTQSPIRYVTPGQVNFARNQQRGSLSYATPDPPLFRNGESYIGQNHVQSNINSHSGFVPQSSIASDSSTISPYNPHTIPSFSPANQQQDGSTVPKYTVENGVRYENKVFWKYPDGRVSDVPPATYVETTYPREYAREQSLTARQSGKSQDSRSIYESEMGMGAVATPENSILSQGPMQFPTISEEAGREPNPYISAESLSTSLPQQQVYRLSYQNLVSQRQIAGLAQRHKANGNAPPSPRPASFKIGPKFDAKNYRQNLSRYMVDSPNPEYTGSYTTEASVNATTPFFSSSNSIASVTSKYGAKVQSYLDKVLSGDEGESTGEKKSFDNNDLSSYSNLEYSDLLNYNPSISEYIRNPSSILNVRPTFVQVGNSLVPVIILRVDGASPIQTKSTQNINLKALLQRYLVQYAKNIQQLAVPSAYNAGTTERSYVKRPAYGIEKNPSLDLIRLTEDDARHSSTYNSNSYVGKSSYETSNLEDSKDFANNRYVEDSSSRGRQKVKNIQIIDDPRFTSYKSN